MKITHDLPFTAYVSLLGKDVEPGEVIEVTAEQAAVLLKNEAYREVKASKTTITGKDA